MTMPCCRPAAWIDPGERWTIREEDLSHPDKPDCPMHDTAFALQSPRFGCKGTRPGSPRGRWGTCVGGLLDDSRPYWDATGDHEHIWIVPMAPNLWYSSFPDAEVAAAALPRSLDLRHGVMRCQGPIRTAAGCWRLESFRFISRADPHLGVERLVLIPEGQAGVLTLDLGLDDSVRNRRGRTPFDAWRNRSTSTDGDQLRWQGLTRGEGQALDIALRWQVSGADSRIVDNDAGPLLRISAAGACTIDRFVALAAAGDGADPAAMVQQRLTSAWQDGFEACFAAHATAMTGFWQRADVEIDGPLYDQQATRFCIFQAGACAPDRDDWSYGAKLLAGPHYHGVVFWDVDLFILPWLTRAFPEQARRHLLFRHRGLDAARAKARVFGYAGAMFPWNTGPQGQESSLGVFGNQEVHIVGDVAWGLLDYIDWTGDDDFMREYGEEMLGECARFWASRLDPDGSISGVIGPDEYAVAATDNAFTNTIARWTLEQAAERCATATGTERTAWRAAASRIPAARRDAHGVIEQAAGYCALPRGPEDREAAFLDKAGHGSNQWIKQADVMMLPVLFPDTFTDDALMANYDYYDARCTYGSSLAHVAYAVGAALAGRMEQAHRSYVGGLSTDLRSRWDSDDGGLHAAACGAATFALQQGFLRLRIRDGQLTYAARLPAAWRSLSVPVYWRGHSRRLVVHDGQTGVV